MTAVTQQYMTDNSYRYFRIFMRESQGIYLGTEWWRKYYMALNELELISNNQNILRSSQYTSTITAGTTGSGSPNVSVIKDGDLSSDASRTGTIWHNHYSWDADEQNIWVQIELNLSVEIQKIRMYHHSFSEWEFLGSNDGVNWNRVYYKVEPTKGDYTFFKWNEYDLTVTSSGITKGVLTWDPSRNGYIGEFSIGENGCSEEFVYNLGSFEGNVNVEILDVDSQYANTSKTINVIDCTTYNLTASSSSVLEGGSVDITLETNAGVGEYPYTISGQGISTSDIAQGLSGKFTIDDSGKSVITLNISEDVEMESNETFTLQLSNGKSSVDVTITNIYYSLSASSTQVNEGETVTVTLNTNAPDGTCKYSIETLGSFDSNDFIENTPLNGFISFQNGSGQVSLTLKDDLITEGAESFIFKLVECGDEPSVTISVNDTSTEPITYSVAVDPPTVNEGGTVTATVTTNGPDGSCNYSLSGSTGFSVTDDLDGNVSSTGTVNIQNGTGTVSFTVKEDYITEGQESFTFQLVGCGDDPSATVTVNDTSTEPIDYSVTANPPTVNEGDTVTITVTTNAPDGSCNYSLSGSTGFSVTDDLDGNVSSTGTVNIQNGTGTVSFTVNEDYITEGQESFTFQLVGCGDNPSATVTVNDTSLTPTPNALLREGGQSPNTWYTGRSISISEDGMVLATTRGTSQSNNNIDIFDYVNGGWVFRSSVHDSNNRVEPLYVDGNDSFAHLGQYQGQLALSSDGKILVAGAHQWKDRSGNWNPDINGWSNIDEGAVFTYHWNENTTSWDYVCITRSSLALGLQANQPPLTDEGQIDPSILGLANLNFGRSVDISDDGTKMIVGCPGDVSVGTDLHDRVYTYNWNSSTQSWDEHSIIYNPRINNGTVEFGSDSSLYQDRSQFGEGVSISGNGQKIVIGAPNWGSESWRDFQIDSQYMYDRWGAGYTSQYGTVYYHKQRGSRGVVFSYTLSNNQWVLQQQQTHEWKLDPNYFTHFPAIYSRYDSIGYDATRWDSSGRVYGLSFGESLSLDYEGNNLIVGCERMLANILDGTSYSGTGGIFIFKRGSDGSWVHELPYDITNTGYDSNSGEMVGETYLTDGAHLNFYENPLNIKIHPPDYEMICTEYSCYDGEANRGTGNSSDFVVPPDDHRPWNYPWCAGTRGYGYDVSYSFSAKRLIVNTWQGDLMNPDSNSPCYDFSTPLIFTLHLNTEGSVIELNNTVEDYWNQDFYEWRDGQ